MKDDWGFSFAGRTIDYFGSKAITSDITALFELVKNSRDANAKQVTIHFKDAGTKNAVIEVYDTGDGMSEDDVMTGKLYEKYRFLEGDRIIVTKIKKNVYDLKAPDTKLYPKVD
ncbi:MAG: ATP-binding protein [Crenarchaeota archaeon]|nr:ATP-binding protein [Thermoproteota archaeon]